LSRNSSLKPWTCVKLPYLCWNTYQCFWNWISGETLPVGLTVDLNDLFLDWNIGAKMENWVNHGLLKGTDWFYAGNQIQKKAWSYNVFVYLARIKYTKSNEFLKNLVKNTSPPFPQCIFVGKICHCVVVGLKQSLNLLRGAFIDRFDFYSHFKIAVYSLKRPGLSHFFELWIFFNRFQIHFSICSFSDKEFKKPNML